jgi:4-amino-4-deoxy-L-arabinose transferase-like glycosyltransferase
MLVAAYAGTSHLLENRFHPDEAHYAAFARLIASGPGHGLLLSHIVVDMPPLSFYVNGLSVALMGPSELALRLPALLCSVVTVALMYALGRRLYGLPAGHASAWAVALSPMAAQFAITAFVDPLMNTLVLAALTLTAARRPNWAAVAVGLAFATKQTALFAIPLILALELWSQHRPLTLRLAIRRLFAAGIPILISLAIVTAALFAWDARRGAPISVWEQGYSDNVGGRPITLAELQPRAAAILFLLGHMSGSTVFNGILIVGLALLLIVDLLRPSRQGFVDLLLGGYVLGYLLLFWLVPFNLWDRYFVPLLPLLALLAGRNAVLAYDLVTRVVEAAALLIAHEGAHIWSRLARIALPLMALAIAVPRLLTTNYDFSPIGGDHGAYDGIDETARFIQTLPPESILYDHWLGWQFEYYLFERRLPIVWFPEMAALERNLRDAPENRALYLAAPWWAPADEARQAAERAGKRWAVVHEAYRRDGIVSVTVYKIGP